MFDTDILSQITSVRRTALARLLGPASRVWDGCNDARQQWSSPSWLLRPRASGSLFAEPVPTTLSPDDVATSSTRTTDADAQTDVTQIMEDYYRHAQETPSSIAPRWPTLPHGMHGPPRCHYLPFRFGVAAMLRDQFDAEGERSVASVLRSGWSSRVVVAAWCLDACFHFSLAPREVKGRCYAFAARARRDPVAELARLLAPLRGASKARLFALDYFEMCSQTHLDLTFLAYLAYDMERLGVLQRHRHMEQETRGRPCCVVCLHEVSLPTIYEPCRHRYTSALRARLHQRPALLLTLR